ncbi:hypothetical protein NDS46_21590 [Paenibacillus thiaminolyticus]|uniref:hypothetical protein n=1 Tax=Paenibacillus thiaminolyticus TaxID=49283 RepID=UPI00232B645B|nr:hypothetical protein [Paenibacillus thiaminolyticus]WCF06916.1 hypothetical protein NDS46_21590 [Paenibacillus thiaminolyticus]
MMIKNINKDAITSVTKIGLNNVNAPAVSEAITGTPQLVFNGKKATGLSYESLKGLLD